MATRVAHPTGVVSLLRRVAGALLALTLVAGNVALCAGWTMSAEARMTCCLNEAQCPMHRKGSSRVHSHDVSQAQADACCAASDRDASQSGSPFSVSIPS